MILITNAKASLKQIWITEWFSPLTKNKIKISATIAARGRLIMAEYEIQNLEDAAKLLWRI